MEELEPGIADEDVSRDDPAVRPPEVVPDDDEVELVDPVWEEDLVETPPIEFMVSGDPDVETVEDRPASEEVEANVEVFVKLEFDRIMAP